MPQNGGISGISVLPASTKADPWKELGAEMLWLIRHRDVGLDLACQWRLHTLKDFVTPLKSSSLLSQSCAAARHESTFQTLSAKQGQACPAINIFAKEREKSIGNLGMSLGSAGAGIQWEFIPMAQMASECRFQTLHLAVPRAAGTETSHTGCVCCDLGREIPSSTSPSATGLKDQYSGQFTSLSC